VGQGQQQGAAGGCGVAARPLLNKGLLLGVSGNPEVAPGSKELAPEGCEAVKILHVGLLLQGPPPASTRRTGGCGSALLSPLTGRLRPKPNDIGQMDLISKEPAPEECGVVKFLHVGLLLLGQPEASSGKKQAAVRGRCSRCWPAGCRSGSWS